MNEECKAMQISSKIISVIMKIGYIVMIVAMCICAATLVFLAATGGQTSIVTSGGTNIIVADGSFANPESVIAACAELLIMSAFLFVIFFLTHRVFRDISATGTPFEKKHVKTIKIVGVLVAAMGIVGGVVDSIAASFAGAETMGILPDAPGVLTGVIIFCLAYVFDYGCALQKRLDEAC